MGITFASENSALCPRCGRAVPSTVDVCECGQTVEDSSAAAPNPVLTPSPSSNESPLAAGTLSRSTPITFFLIITNTLLFLWMTLAGGSTQIQTLLDFGAMFKPYVLRGDYWRLVTPLFLHIGVMHLLMNMYALLVLGGVVERIYGSVRFFYLYLLAGIAGTLASLEFSTAVSAGASGAIFGVSGIALVAGFHHRDRIPSNFKSAVGRGIVPFVLFNLIYGFSNKGIDNYAHLGGLIAGCALALMVSPPAPDSGIRQNQTFAAANALPLAIILFSFSFPLKGYFDFKKTKADFEQALALEKTGKFDESISFYQRALKRSPDLPAIHNNLAVIYHQLQEYAEAEREARAAIRLDEPTAMYHQTLGAILWNQSRLDVAAAEYLRAAALEPGNPEFYESLGFIYEAQGKMNEALRSLEKARSLRPTDHRLDPMIDALGKRLSLTTGPRP